LNYLQNGLQAISHYTDGTLLLVPLMVGVYLVSRVLPLHKFGLVPRSARGAPGIVLMPLLHNDWRHLMSNIIPLTVLLLLLGPGEQSAVEITTIIWLFGGLLLWFLGRRALHIGASLLVFGLCGFHIVNGLIKLEPLGVGIAILVAGLYGATLLRSINPLQEGVSWDGHLAGCVVGAGLAVLYSDIDVGGRFQQLLA